MSNIVCKMGNQMPKAFLWLNVFLAANMTKPAVDRTLAVQTDLFFSFR